MSGIGTIGGYGLFAAWQPSYTSGAASAQASAQAAAQRPAEQAAAPASGLAAAGAVSLPAGDERQFPPVWVGYDPVELGVRARIQYPDGGKTDALAPDSVDEGKPLSEVMEENECQTCKNRKYQDGSDDPGVSYKTPTAISPDRAASAVRSHEQEHVVRERAEAEREDRKVVSQSVVIHTDICPECGRVYVSGGTTRTVTVNDNGGDMKVEEDAQPEAA